MKDGWMVIVTPLQPCDLGNRACQTITVASGNPRLVWEWVMHLVLVVVESKQWFMPFK